MKEYNFQLNLFRSMLRIRRIEERLAERYVEQEMRCPMHLCVGQEAIAVGVCNALVASDRIFSNHRAHGHYLAKGGNLNAMIAEIYGRATGCCGGRGGSMHLIDLDAGFMGATPIVGGTVPIAVGSAWSASLLNQDYVTAVFFGDGCFEEGVMHESLNFAALHNLPIIFVCENNDFSVYTRLSERQPERPIHKLAEAHGMKAYNGNGNNVEEVYSIAKKAIDDSRQGGGPQFLEFFTYRWREHCGPNFDDELDYRTEEEIEVGKQSCPLLNYEIKLQQQYDEFAEQKEIFEKAICEEIDAAFEFALSSEAPPPEFAYEKIYA
ncbi:MAG: thiamine pyrophosphate-dependent dehydrogenase E1 component subunit alpha [Proteobacteria bacterium]|nr:thiamine pyrophosphate-dependent dehydrogenase E1 component subunit alpha [Pseudomonadota bacterium]